MRKTFLVSMVLFLTAQAYAGNVTMSVTQPSPTDRIAAIGYSTSDSNISGFGLKIYTDPNTALITAINNDYMKGESNAAQKGYGIFPGTIDINEANGHVNDWGTPIAPSTAPGAAGTGLNTNTIIVEMGALYRGTPNQPPQSGTLLSVTVDSDCTVCVTGEPIRGKVVLTDATQAVWASDPVCASITVSAGCGDCPYDIIQDGYLTIEDVYYVFGLLEREGCVNHECDMSSPAINPPFTPQEKCLDAIQDGYLTIEDVYYIFGLLESEGCVEHECPCPIQ